MLVGLYSITYYGMWNVEKVCLKLTKFEKVHYVEDVWESVLRAYSADCRIRRIVVRRIVIRRIVVRRIVARVLMIRRIVVRRIVGEPFQIHKNDALESG